MRLRLAILAVLALSALAAAPASAVTLPPGFEDVPLASGLDSPTAIDWAPDGRMFIAELHGRIKVLEPGEATPRLMLDISDHVNNYNESGLLGIAVDSDFEANGYLYLLYTHDANPADEPGPKSSRLTRVKVAEDSTLEYEGPDAETVILGKEGTEPCPPPAPDNDCIAAYAGNHTIGTVRSDPDGTLWVSSGDAAGTLSDMLRAYDENSYNGKLIHIDRDGNGLEGHRFCPDDDDLTHVCTKIHAKGFRNPFRFSLRTAGPPFVSDVGWNSREEIDLPVSGGNYGWPCYEGSIRTPGNSADPRCSPWYALEGTADAARGPVYECPHEDCQSIIAGPEYTATAFPPEYHGDVFFGDYVVGFVKRLRFDSSDNVTEVLPFATGLHGFVDLELAPNGDLVYTDFGGGQVRSIRSTAADRPPVARASANPTSGPAPLTVQFTGSDSSDAAGEALDYSWDFGDGGSSTEADPQHEYTDGSQNFTATLTVSDPAGQTDRATVEVSPGNNPPSIDSLDAPASFRAGGAVALSGSASDPEDGPLTGDSLQWRIRLRHGTHYHPFAAASGGTAGFTAFDNHDSDSLYEVTLKATDARGLVAQRTVEIDPETRELNLRSDPPGARITYGGRDLTTPVTKQAAVGFRTQVSASERMRVGSTRYVFDHWSDGGARLHEITVPDSDSTLTAHYRELPRSGYAAAVLNTSGLLAYWRLGEPLGPAALDETATYDGSYVNGVTLGQPGALPGDPDTSARFDGVDDVVASPGTAPPLGLSTRGTLEGWFNWEGGQALMRDSTHVKGWILAFDNGGRLSYRVGDTQFNTTRTTSSVRNGWHHFALTVDSGRTAFYIDGALVHSGSGAGSTPAVTPWVIMRNGLYPDQSTRGRADEVAIYDVPLSAATIAAHHRAAADGAAPNAPTGLTAEPRERSVRLDWADNTESDLAGYEVHRSTTPGGPYTRVNGTLVTGSAYTDGGLTNGTTYHYIVKAVDTSGNASPASGAASATPVASPPDAPTGLGASSRDRAVALDWDDNGESDLAGYDVFRATATGGPYVKVNGGPVLNSSYTDSGLANGTTYYYVVQAVDNDGNPSGNSAEASATPTAPPAGAAYSDTVLATPGLVSYWRLGDGSGTTAVDQKGAHNGSYSGGVTLGQPGALPSDTDPAALFDGVNGVMQAGGSGLALGNAGTIEGWFYWESGIAMMRDTTWGGGWIVGYEQAGNLAYRVGGAQFVTSRSAASMRGGWHHLALTVGGGSTRLYVDGALLHSGTVSSPATAVMPWNVMRNGQYANQSSRGRADEIAVYSSALSAATVADHFAAAAGGGGGGGGTPADTPPAAPAGLTATGRDGAVDLDWADSGESDLAHYDVYRSTSAGGPYTKVNGSPVTSSSYANTGLSNGTRYYYVVRAVDLGGNASGNSAEASATPSAPPTGTGYRSTVLATPGLVSYWRLGETLGSTATDQTGAYNGSYSGGVTLGQPGALTSDPDPSAFFDGANDVMQATGSRLALSTAGTLEGWFFWDSGLALMRDNTGSRGWILGYDNYGTFAYRVGGTQFLTGRSASSMRGAWHHVALTFGGGHTALYVDGSLVHSGVVSGPLTAALPWNVMRNGVYASQSTRGRADEIAVYDTALSAATIAAHYNSR